MQELKAKNKNILFQLLRYPYEPELIQLLFWIEETYPWFKLKITSGFRAGDMGVHGTNPCRGLDLRCRLPNKWVGRHIERGVKNHWSYDFERPHLFCCNYHTVKKNKDGWHLHLQVHPNTKLLKH